MSYRTVSCAATLPESGPDFVCDSCEKMLMNGEASQGPFTEMKTVIQSLKSTGCPGCFFLYTIIDIVNQVINPPGRSIPDADLKVMINSTMLSGPKALLAMPLGTNVFREARKIDVFKEAGEACPWTAVEGATITSGDTSSSHCLATVKRWLQLCQDTHPRCQKDFKSTMPTRVLDLAPKSDGMDDIFLVETSSISLAEYACLSHRWSDSTPTTTYDNIRERKGGISWDTLPKAYQDSIVYTRKLGLRYLWIDSLCIIQGSNSPDWINEAPKMAAYYQNAYITLSASNSGNQDTGFFSKDPSQTVKVILKPSTRPEYSVNFRIPISHNESNLHTRGWVYQEHVLSSRVIHFQEKELIWECKSDVWCECSRINPKIGVFQQFERPSETYLLSSHGVFKRKLEFNQAMQSFNPNVMRDTWRDIVSDYTRKALTFPSDIFPALAGLAKHIASTRNLRYLAGLWEDTLATDILWSAADIDGELVGARYPRPREWRAPSWSWASTTAPVNWSMIGCDMESGSMRNSELVTEVWVEDLSVVCDAVHGNDGTMGVRAGILAMRGFVVKAPFGIGEEGELIVVDEGDSRCDFGADYDLRGEDLDVEGLKCVLVASIQETYYFSLVLKPDKVSGRKYERIGFLGHRKRLDDGEAQGFVIIV